MTSEQMSKALEKLGIQYAAGSVRSAWSRGAPKDSAEAFVVWLSTNAERKSAASEAAKGMLEVESAKHGISLILALLRDCEVLGKFWLPAGPIFWESLTRARKTKGRPVGAILGEKGFTALNNIICGLGVLAEIAPDALEEIKADGYNVDAGPWVAAARANPQAMLARGREAYARFANMPEE